MIAVAALATTGVSGGSGVHAGSAAIRIANAGRAATVSAASIEAFPRVALTGDARVMAVKGGTAYLRVARDSDIECFAVGRAPRTASTYALSAIACPLEGFPAPGQPVLDMSVVEIGKDGSNGPHFVDVRGFASDGVARVDVLDAGGATLDTAAVVGNVYDMGAVPEAAVRLVARDASGKVLYSLPR